MARKRSFWQIYADVAVVLIVGMVILVGIVKVVRMHRASREYEEEPFCLSNVKQLALGMMLYARDWDGRLPATTAWAQDVVPYLGRIDPGVGAVFTCPAQKHAPQIQGIAWRQGQGLSYAMSLAMPPKATTDARTWAYTPMLFDSDIVPAARPEQAAPRHNDGAIFGFADGHARWLRPDSISAYRPRGRRPGKAP